MSRGKTSRRGLLTGLVVALILLIGLLPAAAQEATQEATYTPQVVEYTLHSQLGGQPPMAFVGVGGTIDGQVNPTLTANVGDTVRVTFVNADGVLHSFTQDTFGATTGQFNGLDEARTVEFVVTQPGEFNYFCDVPGHREAGMQGKLLVAGEVTVGNQAELQASRGNESYAWVQSAPAPVVPADPNAVSIVRNPAEVPPPVGDRGPINLRVDMTTMEVSGILADGTTYPYFTFDGKVPGPFLRVRIGDTIEFHLTNDQHSMFPHSIDLHAVTGPGGGAVYTQTAPGQTTSFTFQAINPGLYVYHCATASIPHHISSGMYGLILVEPEGGLPPVDREFYVMQGDIYTQQPFGQGGHDSYDAVAMSNEDPTYLVFNGQAGGLTTDQNALRAHVGETVRIYFGVGGPNITSSFHVIGEIFDRVYNQGSLTSPPLTDVQTTLVPTGGSTIVEFTVDVPGRYILVDHSLARLERGLVGFLFVDGPEQPDIFHGNSVAEASGH
ncbi:MAG: copper-containing nitrite reductase [Anaerolineae bacterium]